MTGNRMSKLSASLMVLMMALVALAAVPGQSAAQTSSGVNIYVPVGSSGVAVSNAWVNLTDMHTGAVIAATFSSSSASYVVANAPSGYYRVDVVHPDYYDEYDAAQIRFEGFTNYTVNPPIQLTPFPFKAYQWNVTVRDSATNRLVSGATVGFYDPDPEDREFVDAATTNALGVALVDIFPTSLPGEVQLVVMKSMYETYVEDVVVSGSNVTTVYLTASKRVTGFVTDAGGPANGVVSYLINHDQSVSWVKRVLKSTGSFMAFDAYPGNFTLVVDAQGDSAHVQTVTVVGSDVALTIPQLLAQTQRLESVSMTFGGNYGSFSLAVDTTWSYDDAHPALRYADMGSLRAQIDLLLGDGNGFLSAAEVGLFRNMVESLGTQYVSSSNLLLLNETVFESSATIGGYVMDMASDVSVISTVGVRYAYTCQYNAHGGVDVGAPSYSSVCYARYDSASVNYSYTIVPVAGYELVDNSSTSRVTVSGYLTIVVDPATSTSGTEPVSLTFEESLVPDARGTVDVSKGNARAIYVSGNLSHYIVSVQSNITFISSQSYDPNGNPLTFSWDFGDGGYLNDTRNLTAVHNYSSAAENLTVTLTVVDVAGLVNSTTMKVVCDGLLPTPVITVKSKVVSANTIEINQRESVTFNATSSYDDAASAGDKLGQIDWIQFEWGDGNVSDKVPWSASEQNISFSYERSGTYTLVLNVSDVVGHWKNTTMTVKVNDTEAPTVSFVALNSTWGSLLVENKTVYFNASATFDNVDAKELLNYSWDFGDGEWFNGTGLLNVTHNYTKVGQVVVKLNVTDLSGNWRPASKSIRIESSPRPDMSIVRVYYDPEDGFTEGQTGYILVNMTNKGSANATNIVLTFYLIREDVTTTIGTWSQILQNDSVVTIVKPGESCQVKFPWSPSDAGTYSLRVNVTSDGQLRPGSFTASGDSGITVSQAPWKDWVLWIGVVAVIILVPLLLYVRGRWQKVEKKGPRREKKEKPKGGEEEL